MPVAPVVLGCGKQNCVQILPNFPSGAKSPRWKSKPLLYTHTHILHGVPFVSAPEIASAYKSYLPEASQRLQEADIVNFPEQRGVAGVPCTQMRECNQSLDSLFR